MANSHSLDLELSSSQYAYVADSVSLSLTGDFTFEFWLKLEQLPSNAGTSMFPIAKAELGDISYLVNLSSGDDKIAIRASDDGTTDATHTVVVTSEDAVTAGSWVHYAISFDISGESGQWYVDTVADTSASAGTMGAAIVDSNQAFAIGARYAGGTPQGFLDGLIDEVRIWNDIRTSTEISDNYQKQLVGNEAGLVAYYKFNNDYTDSQTSGNNDLTKSDSLVFSTDVPFVGVVSNFFAIL